MKEDLRASVGAPAAGRGAVNFWSRTTRDGQRERVTNSPCTTHVAPIQRASFNTVTLTKVLLQSMSSYGGPAPGVAASGVRFQASGRSHAVWTSRCTPLPDQLLADTLTQPP